MQDIRRDFLDITQNEDAQLVAKLVAKGTPNYVIRDRLMERGHSAAFANRMIVQVRRTVEENDYYSNQMEALTIGIVLLFAAIIIILYFVLPAIAGR